MFDPNSGQPYGGWLREDLCLTPYPLICVPLFCEVHISNSMKLIYTYFFCQDSLFRLLSIVWTFSVPRHLCWLVMQKQWNLRYSKWWKLNCNFVEWSWKLPHLTVMCEVTTHYWLNQLFVATTFRHKRELLMLKIFTYHTVLYCHVESSISVLWLYCCCSL